MNENPTGQQFIPYPQPVEEEKKKDDMSDLFEVNRDDILDTEDVVGVNMERDILDANEEGNLDDLTTVTDEDIMGSEMYGQSPLENSVAQKRRKAQQVVKPVYRIVPPPQVGGLNV